METALDKDAEKKRRDEALTEVKEAMQPMEISAIEENPDLEESEANKEAVETANKETLKEDNNEDKPADANKEVKDTSADDKKEKTDKEPSKTTKELSKSDKKDSKTDKKSKIEAKPVFKTLVNNIDLFSAFAYFDENVTGYIFKKLFV